MKCWASPLGDCAGGQSREHIISKTQFEDDTITVSGMPWCPKPKQVGLASLVRKNLCVAHNNRLGAADREALLFRLSIKAHHQSRILPVQIKLDARLIEQWLLKTTINLALQSPDSGLRNGGVGAACLWVRSYAPRRGILRCR